MTEVASTFVRVDAPSDAGDLLAQSSLLGALAPAERARVQAAFEWLHVPGGSVLFHEGDEADGLYLVAAGRLRVNQVRAGLMTVVAEIDRGASVGEHALLTAGRRSGTVVAVRDSIVGRLSVEHVERMIRPEPEVAWALARLLAVRMAANTERTHVAPARVMAMVRVGSLEPLRFDALVDQLARSVPAALLDRGLAPAEVVSHLARLEVDHERVLVAVSDPHVDRHLLRQADRILVVVDGRDRPALGLLEQHIKKMERNPAAPPLELVLVHPRSTAHPRGTARWLALAPFVRHHHLRDDTPGDLERLARHVAGRSIALVLGGGGARGAAHIGVVRACRELGIPIDRVGGSSIGAIVGAHVALGWDPSQMTERLAQAFSEVRVHRDFTLPTVSILSGRRLQRFLTGHLADMAIEDLWLDFFCTTVDLSDPGLVVHQRGRVAQWIQASASLPGLFPPVVDDHGHLHVDGSQLDNVPTGIMRADHPGIIIGVDVSPLTDVPGRSNGTSAGWRFLLGRRRGEHGPGIVEILNRTALVGSRQRQGEAASRADVYLTLPVQSFGLVEFERIAEIEETGYRWALETLGRTDIVRTGGPLSLPA